MACSAAERMLDCGALTTITPRSVAAATSTLSSPMPARPTTTRSVPAASTSAVTVVAERMTRACGAGHGRHQLLGGQIELHVDLVAGFGHQFEAGLGQLSVTSTLPMGFLSFDGIGADASADATPCSARRR